MCRSFPLLLLVILTAPALAQVAIHEIVYDGVGTDPDEVFTELTGPAGLRLDGWSLEAVNGGTGNVYRSIPLDDVEIPADGVLLIATSSAAGVVLEHRDLIASVDWQNGPDAVRLVDPDGQITDALQYGDAAEHNAGEGIPAPATAAGQSLSRDDLGTDTGDNVADFTISTPTPGVAIIPLPAGATLSLPDTLGRPGQLLDLPLLVSGNGAGLLAAEVAVIFDAQMLIPVTVTPAEQTSTWQIAAHVTQGEDWQDTLRIALATAVDTLAGDAALLRLTFRVADEPSPATGVLRLAQAVLDDGTTAAGLVDGSLLRVGFDAVLTADASGFALPQRLMLQVEDQDEDRTEGIDTVHVTLVEGDTVETVTLVEDAIHSAVFAGAVEARHAAVIPGDGIVQMRPRQPTRACFVDSLTAVGTTEPVCMEWIARGHDATIQVSHAIEPGDTLWFRVRDQDLDRDSLTNEIAMVTVHSVADTIQHLLTPLNSHQPVFDAALPSSRLDSIGVLRAAAGDAIIVTYLDTATADGDQIVRSDTALVVGHFGDADGNGVVQAFDANAILRHVITPFLRGGQFLAANVDSLAPDGDVTPLDASLVLQQRVGLLKRFPVQSRAANNHPGPQISGAGPAARPAMLARQVSLRQAGTDLLLWVDDRSGIVAADLTVSGVTAADVHAASQGFLIVHRRSGDHWHIALAGAVAASGPGPLIRWQDANAASSAGLEQVRLNDVDIPDAMSASMSMPSGWRLELNHPNPFNGQTVIPLFLSGSSLVQADILSVLGQRIRPLAAGTMPAGKHLLHWDGTDEAGHPAATGVYTVRVRVEGGERRQRIMLLR